MSTINSLVCWGGRTGKTVTISNASPAVVTSTGHGVRDGLGLVFTSSGSLPTGITSGTTYYARSIDADTVHLYDTAAHAIAGGSTGRVNTSSAGSGTHTVKSDLIVHPATRLAPYGLSDLSRWGSSGSERIYDGIVAWNAARAGASIMDEEVCELGEGFIEQLPTTGSNGNYTTDIDVPAAKTTIISKINGKRSEAFHQGQLNKGYAIGHGYYGFKLWKWDTETNGFISICLQDGYRDYADGGSIQSMILMGNIAYAGNGIVLNARGTIDNCLIMGFGTGIAISYDAKRVKASNNITTKNDHGIRASVGNESMCPGFYYNNISVGNVTDDWGTAPNFNDATGNCGPSGTAWVSGTGSRATIATSNFANWGSSSINTATDNMRPALSSSPQVEFGKLFLGVLMYDIVDNVRPDYLNGAPTYLDAGCYEFDHGFGPPPATCTLTLTNVVVGSRINIRDQAGTTTHYDAVAAANTVVIPINVYSSDLDNWRVRVRKASGSPNYIPYETLMTASVGSTSIYVSQIPDE